MKTLFFTIFGIFLLSACGIFQSQPTLKGSYYQACEPNNYRVLTFEDNNIFKEELSRPHLGTAVYYGQGTYMLEEDLLTLHYEAFNDEPYHYEMVDTRDTFPKEMIAIRLYFKDYESDEALPSVSLALYSADGEEMGQGTTDRKGYYEFAVMLRYDDDDGMIINAPYMVSASYPFYQDMQLSLEQSFNENIHIYEVKWRAGTANRKESGTESLRIADLGDDEFTVKSEDYPDGKCRFVREVFYENWLEEIMKEMR